MFFQPYVSYLFYQVFFFSFLAEENLNSNLFEGDILTTPKQMKAINHLIFHHAHDSAKSVEKPYIRGLVKSMRRTWPQRIVYYKISDSLGKKNFFTKFIPTLSLVCADKCSMNAVKINILKLEVLNYFYNQHLKKATKH